MFRPGHSTGGAARTRVALLRRVAQSAGILAAAATLIFTTSPPAAAQSTGRITGVVTDSASDRPVSDVQVVVVGNLAAEFGDLLLRRRRGFSGSVAAGRAMQGACDDETIREKLHGRNQWRYDDLEMKRPRRVDGCRFPRGRKSG